MIYLKHTYEKIKENIVGEKSLIDLQNSFLFQLVFLSTIKDYIYGQTTQQKVFVIPECVRTASKKNKKILVLDMDETLVHTRSTLRPTHKNYSAIPYDGEDMYVEYRPHMGSFLEAVSEIFTVYVYTAGNKTYADTVLNHIDKKNVIQERFYRKSCKKQNGTFIKDLKYLKNMLKTKKEMILVDDNNQSIGFNYPFAIKIQPFEGDQSDKYLASTFEKLLKFYQY